MAITPAFQAGDVSSILTIRSTNDERVINRVSWGNTARIPQQIGRRKVNERQWRIGNSWGRNPNWVWKVYTNSLLYSALVKNLVDSLVNCDVAQRQSRELLTLRSGSRNSPSQQKTMVFPTQRMSTIQSGIGIQHPQPGPRENSDEAVKNGARRVLHHCFYLVGSSRGQDSRFSSLPHGFESRTDYDEQHGGYVLKRWITCQWWPMGLFVRMVYVSRKEPPSGRKVRN